MGIKSAPNPYFEKGKAIHRIIQDHVSKAKVDERLSYLNLYFPIVERYDFDPRCKIYFQVNKKYSIKGYVDGYNPDNFRSLEIKTGSKRWSLNDFKKSPQRKIYCIGLSMIKENVLIYAPTEDFIKDKPKKMIIEVTKEDIEEGWNWIKEGIKKVENIKEEVRNELESTDGRCVDPRCYYGNLCQFK